MRSPASPRALRAASRLQFRTTAPRSRERQAGGRATPSVAVILVAAAAARRKVSPIRVRPRPAAFPLDRYRPGTGCALAGGSARTRQPRQRVADRCLRGHHPQPADPSAVSRAGGSLHAAPTQPAEHIGSDSERGIHSPVPAQLFYGGRNLVPDKIAMLRQYGHSCWTVAYDGRNDERDESGIAWLMIASVKLLTRRVVRL
jgi:hypothetical protein